MMPYGNFFVHFFFLITDIDVAYKTLKTPASSKKLVRSALDAQFFTAI